MNKFGALVGLSVAVLTLTACGGPESAQSDSKVEASAPAADGDVRDPLEAEWEALTSRNRETMCKLSDGVSAESAAESMEFYGKQARPSSFDVSAKAHARRVALMEYAQKHCN
ncbi:hypothetical protein OG746_08395 [Streptomyces sp. NBC_01016]|uniref:hypothetical protein n=1 Tax=Streptomyces sp. NBC_01016 TaxID=2903720 RepID=UPI0022536246|nr:hypothetical protein [Streptomyces sp. NBC_01016]MCX4828743.1 hypothetical protein [Streptomyces sp. NBC_01016]